MSEAKDLPMSPNEPAQGEQKYRAPALEKGLDVLELLSSAPGPYTATQIASALGKSLSELFRMLQVLEHRGYIADEDGDGYVLTDKLFALGLVQAPIRSLMNAALPVMERLANRIGQSCHLVVSSGDQMVVVARIECPSDLSFSVRVGYRRRIVESMSGTNLFGFQPEDVQQAWLPALMESCTETELATFRARVKTARQNGYAIAPSDFVSGVTDISAPVMGQRGAVAALTVPFLQKRHLDCSIEDAVVELQKAVQRISAALAGDNKGYMTVVER